MSIQLPLFLIGFMGAGKTSAGEKLSEICDCPVIDTDQEIVKKAKMAIPQIFAEFGEDYFRKLETEVLQELSSEQAIITTGGGIIVNETNRGILKSGTTIFLKAHPQAAFERINGDTGRPLIQNKSVKEITDMYQSRLPLYIESAAYVIDTTELTIEQVAEKIYNHMNA